MHVPLTNLFEPNHNFQEAIVTIIVALNMRGLAHGPQYAPPPAAYTWGSGRGGKVAIKKLPSLSRCGNPQPDFLDPTKCFQPLPSAYTRHYRLWLGSPTLG